MCYDAPTKSRVFSQPRFYAHMSNKANYCLSIGDVTLDLTCTPSIMTDFLADWFNQPSSSKTPDIHLDLDLIPHADAPTLPNSLMTTKTRQSDGQFNISDGLITGHYDPKSRQGVIKAKATLVRGQLMRVLEQIFYQAFNSACPLHAENQFLIHSSAVIHSGQGFLFVGPSEAGKTTVARCSSHLHVLGDEMNIIKATEDGLELIGTPFNGTFREKKPGRAPLRAVFLLEHLPSPTLTQPGLAETVSTLAAEVVPAVGLDDLPSPQTVPVMVDQATLLAQSVPYLRLGFRPDPGFWRLIEQRFDLVSIATTSTQS